MGGASYTLAGETIAIADLAVGAGDTLSGTGTISGSIVNNGTISANDGALVFANSAFSEMVGRAPEDVVSLKFDEIFHLPLSTESAVAVLQSLANEVVELAHRDGSSVRALMSRSALIRADDDIALATFQDLTEQLWLDER